MQNVNDFHLPLEKEERCQNKLSEADEIKEEKDNKSKDDVETKTENEKDKQQNEIETKGDEKDVSKDEFMNQNITSTDAVKTEWNDLEK